MSVLAALDTLSAALTPAPSAVRNAVNTTALLSELAELRTAFSSSANASDSVALVASASAALPPDVSSSYSVEAVGEMLTLASEKWDILTLWAPSTTWWLLFLFLVAFARRFALVVLGRLSTGAPPKQSNDLQASRRAASIFSHGLNLILSTTALGFQLSAAPALALPIPGFEAQWGKSLYLVGNLITLAYVVELLCTDAHLHLVMHHVLTFGLFFLSAIAIDRGHDIRWFNLCIWMALQATIEQPVYLAMLLNHLASYLHLRNAKPAWQQRCLRVSGLLCRFNTFWSYPQKLVPLGFALYWLSQLFDYDLHYNSVTGFVVIYALIALVAMAVLDLYFLELNWSLTSHICAKTGGSFPAQSPMARLLRRRLRKPAASATLSSETSSIADSVKVSEHSVVLPVSSVLREKSEG